eukprot:6172825-Pleurochrysis_carterae.AAC.2
MVEKKLPDIARADIEGQGVTDRKGLLPSKGRTRAERRDSKQGPKHSAALDCNQLHAARRATRCMDTGSLRLNLSTAGPSFETYPV